MENATGLVNPWLLDVSYDIVPLITRQARVDAAQEGRNKVYLELLWQEWQVIQRARSLAVAIISGLLVQIPLVLIVMPLFYRTLSSLGGKRVAW